MELNNQKSRVEKLESKKIRSVKTTLIVLFYLLTIPFVFYLIFIGQHKTSAGLFLFDLFLVASAKSWNIKRMARINDSFVYLFYTLSAILGVWGFLFDFLTGALYFLAGFFILVFTKSYKNQSVTRSLIMVLNIGLFFLSLAFYLIFV